MKKIVLIVFILVFTSTGFAGLKFGPSYTEISLYPGEEKRGTLYLENTGKKPVKLICVIKDFKNSGINRKLSWKKWLIPEFSLKKIFLKPGEKKLLHYKVIAPEKFKGEVSAKVSFIQLPCKEGTSINLKLSVVIYLISRKNSYIGAEIKNITITNLKNNSRFSFVITNTGNIHLRPNGVIKILKNKKSIASINVQKQFPLFEGKRLRVTRKVPSLSDGIYQMNINLNSGYKDIPLIQKKIYFKIKKGKIFSFEDKK